MQGKKDISAEKHFDLESHNYKLHNVPFCELSLPHPKKHFQFTTEESY